MPGPNGAVSTKKDFDIVKYSKTIDFKAMREQAIAKAAARKAEIKTETQPVDDFDIVQHVDTFDFSALEKLDRAAKSRKTAVKKIKEVPVKVEAEDNYKLVSDQKLDIKRLTGTLIMNLSPYWR